MKRSTGFFRTMLPLMVLAAAVSCSVHEWPEAPELETYTLRLAYETELPLWDQELDARADEAAGSGMVDYGFIRTTVRAYPVVDGTVQQAWSDEFTLTRNVAQGYDGELTIRLVPGDYRLMVWSELAESEKKKSFYDATDFTAVKLVSHTANTDYRDAFRGTLDISVASYTSLHETPSGTVTMQRPLAKYEFVTTDLAAFFAKETRDNSRAATVSLDEYEVVFHYTGYMPDEYNMDIDKPTDSATGVQFKSSLTRINDDEASMGFDYVFVNGEETAVTVQIALVRKADGKQVSMTPPIRVPLRRSVHTVVRGSFLLSDASGGMGIDPGYDGDHNMSF